MQRALVILALLAAPVAASSSQSTATAWLQSHKSPTQDQLGELANANPAAFAIVQALLSKHAKHAQLSAEERGPDVFRRMMNEGTHIATSSAKGSVALPYANTELAEVRAPVVDQAHYNVKTASDRDESAVDRLLSAVASMGGKKGKKIALLRQKHAHKQEADNLLTKDADLFGGDAQPAAPVQAVEAAAAQAVAVEEPVAAPPQKHENSYLKGIDLSGDMPEAVGTKKRFSHHDMDSSNSLATFSFGDDAPPAPVPKKVVVAPKPKKDNSFLNWLGLVKKAPAPEAAPVAPVKAPPAAKKGNSYLDSVHFLDNVN